MNEFVVLGTVITTMNISLTKAPLHPAMIAIDGYLLVLCDLFENIDVHRHATLTTYEAESLHQLRISIRQARSVLREGRKVLPAELLRAMSEDLSWLSSITSASRDLDVLLEHWPQYERMMEPREVSRLQVIVREINNHHKEAYREMCAQLNGQRAIALINEWQVMMLDGTDFGSGGPDAYESLTSVVTRRLSRAQNKLVHLGHQLTVKSSDTEIHNLRKDVKKIKYLIESFEEIFILKRDQAIVSKLSEMHDLLGRFQDLRVHEDVVSDTLSYLRPMCDPTTISAIENLLENMHQKRKRLRKKVIAESLHV